VPREALVALAPVVGLAIGGKARHAILAAAALAILLAGVAGAVAAGLLSSPFTHVGVHNATGSLGSLKENFWSGRVLEWLAVAGVAGALRGRLAAGAMIGIALLAAFVSRKGGDATPLAQNLSLLRTFLPVWPAVALAIASLPLLVPGRHIGAEATQTPAEGSARS
jgi:hypothetical protein